MLSINEFVNQKKKNVIFVNTQKTNERHVIFVIEFHSKFIKNWYNIEFEYMFTINNSNQRFFDQKNWTKIAFCNNVKFSIINT